MKIRNTVGAIVLTALVGYVASTNAYAWEPGYSVNTLPGISMGLPLGANPPPGVYYINYANYGSRLSIKGDGSSYGLPDGSKADVASFVGQLMWSTPYQILGGSILSVITVPAADVSIYNGNNSLAHFAGVHNMVFGPVNISWNLGGGLFGMIGLEFAAPTGTIGASPAGNNLGNVGTPYWTIEPKVALSYLGDGFNLTAVMRYGFNTKNTASQITNGNYFNLELTATKKFDKWEFGPVAYYSAQVSPDRNCPMGTRTCARGSLAGLGPLIGYDFGPVTARLMVTTSVYKRNYNDGLRVWSQLVIPLYVNAPPASKPVSARF